MAMDIGGIKQFDLPLRVNESKVEFETPNASSEGSTDTIVLASIEQSASNGMVNKHTPH